MIGKRLLFLGLCLFVFCQIAQAEVLEKDTVIQGIKFPKGTTVFFYLSGELKLVYLSQNQKIQGIWCGKEEIEFYKSGKLEIAEFPHYEFVQEIQGIKCKKGDRVEFDKKGHLVVK